MTHNSLKRLKMIYFVVLLIAVIIIVPTHLFPPPTFMYARFPHYLEMMPTFLGFSWPATFQIYHYVLYTLIIIVSLNVVGIMFYPKFKQIAIASSTIGVFLISLMVLFFFLVFINVNPSTAIIYGLYSVALLTVDILTFKTLFIKQTEA